jgi:hypothetical protein
MERFVLRMVVVLGALFAAFAVAVVALGFLATGLYLLMAGVMPAFQAAFLTGFIGLLAILIVLLVGAWAVSRRGPARPLPMGAKTPDGTMPDGKILGEPMQIAMLLGNLLGKRALGTAKSHAYTTVLGGLAAGFVYGLSPKVREILRNLMKTD